MGERLFLQLAGGPSYAPVSSVPVGTTVEHRGWDELADHVAQISVYREKLSGLVHERIVPDGAVRLMFDLGLRLGSADLAGPFAQAALVPLDGAVANLTVTLGRSRSGVDRG